MTKSLDELLDKFTAEPALAKSAKAPAASAGAISVGDAPGSAVPLGRSPIDPTLHGLCDKLNQIQPGPFLGPRPVCVPVYMPCGTPGCSSCGVASAQRQPIPPFMVAVPLPVMVGRVEMECHLGNYNRPGDMLFRFSDFYSKDDVRAAARALDWASRELRSFINRMP